MGIVLSHSWASSADDWDTQMMFILLYGNRAIALDRRRVMEDRPSLPTATT
jgi:hypothetical protein